MMIDKKELRIGNLVFVDGHREMLFTVLQLKTKVAVLKGITTFQAEYEILSPVQLTRKMLEERLFIGEAHMEKQITPNLILSLSMLDDSGKYQLSLIEGSTDETVDKDSADNRFPAQKNNSVRLSAIQYLHQLQNTYFEIGRRETI